MSGSMEDFFTSGRRIKNSPAAKEKSEPVVQEKQKREFVKNVPMSTPPSREETLAEIEERKRYPERTFDRYIQKGARLKAEDIDLLKIFCSEITRAKRELPYEYRSNKRITDNTVLRVLLSSFCEQIEDRLDTISFKGLQTEGELKNFIEETMKF
jgi:hypothetical protein